jgi:cysteine synthase
MRHTQSMAVQGSQVHAAQDRTVAWEFLYEKTARTEIAHDEQQSVEAILSAIGSPGHFCYAARGAGAVLSPRSSGSCQPPTSIAKRSAS